MMSCNLQDELLDLKNDSDCRDLFEIFSVTEFRLRGSSCIHISAETALKIYCLSPLRGCMSQPSHPY